MAKGTHRHWHLLLLLVPYIWAVALIPLVNKAQGFVFGLPTLLLWMGCTPICATLCLGIVYWWDKQSSGPEQP